MKGSGFFFLLLVASVRLYAQADKKVDSVVKLVRQYFNEQSADKLYDLTGQKFQKAVSAEQFRSIGQNNLFPLGEMPEPAFVGMEKGLSKYKLDFDAGAVGLYLSLDSADKLQGFLFKPFVEEPTSPTKINSVESLSKFVDATAADYLKRKAADGLSIGVLQNGQTTFYHYNKKGFDKTQTPNNRTLYEIGSVTKTFTALLLALAVNEGKVKLDDPVSKFLPPSVPKLQFEGVPVTLKTLANHTSGLPRMSDNFDTLATDAEDPYKLYGEKELLAFYKTFKPVKKPGTAYEYSNLGMATLGWVLEKVYKKGFAQLVAEKIAAPLRMKDTKAALSPAEALRLLPGHNEKGAVAKHWNFKVYAPAGALHSTLADMMLYAQAMTEAAPPALLAAVKLTQTPTFDDGNNKLGLGWHFIKPGKDEWLFHNGGTFGFSSYLAVNKKNGTAVVVLSNAGVSVDETGNSLMKALEQ